MTGDAIGGSGLLYFIFSSIYSGIFFRIMLEMYSLVTQVKNIYIKQKNGITLIKGHVCIPEEKIKLLVKFYREELG